MSRLAIVLLWALAAQAPAAEVAAPPEHRRGPEQTYLTYPEWFLVHSPAEYAAYVREHTPTRFPFVGHIRQFWQSYGAVTRATKQYPFNFGYHVMVSVIGISTTVEYGLRSAYETLLGRVSELAMRHGLSDEDRYGAAVAQDYVDFIRREPWYEYDFAARLRGLWTDTPLWGRDALRKWERKYALSTEYLVKAGYAWLIKKATRASYDVPLPVTAVLLDRLPEGIQRELPGIKLLSDTAEGPLVLVPRYDPFTLYASGLAARGAAFREIAGNRSDIVVSAIVPDAWQEAARVLFSQPILTRPGQKRVVLVVPVARLSETLNRLAATHARLEHVYDF